MISRWTTGPKPYKNAAVFLKERGVWGLGLPPIGTQDIIH